jgi:Mg2+-importing ATPase
VAFVVRTRRPLFRSRPGRLLLASTAAVIALALALPFLPFAGVLGFTPLPRPVVASLVAITALYVLVTEVAKAGFFRRAA